MIAKIWFIRTSGAPSSARLAKFSYEAILEAIGQAVNPVMGDTIGTLVVLSAETHQVISTVTFDIVQSDEQDTAVERVLNEVWVALEEEGRIPQVR
jgi:hypothetical protein